VMGAMNEFLLRLERSPEVHRLYANLDALWNERAARLNQRLSDAGLPLQVCNLSTIWTVRYTRPSRYNWMLQFYLRAQGLALSWVGTGRLIFSLNYTEQDFAAVADRIVAGARSMEMDGWWWQGAALTNRAIKRRITREMLRARLGRPPVSGTPPSPSEAPAVPRG
jgi:glutamate-1-semialdehyde 2,1-aminomutase